MRWERAARGHRASTNRSRYLFGLGPAAILEERPDGTTHGFALRSRASTAAAIAAFVDPRKRANTDGELHRFQTTASPDPDQITELELRLATAEAVARVFVTCGTDTGVVDQDFSVATLDDGV